MVTSSYFNDFSTAEAVCMTQTKKRLAQYCYIHKDDETPSTISRNETDLVGTGASSSNKKQARQRHQTDIMAFNSQSFKSEGLKSRHTATQSKVLQSMQSYSMLLEEDGKFTSITGSSVNWLQLLERSTSMSPHHCLSLGLRLLLVYSGRKEG